MASHDTAAHVAAQKPDHADGLCVGVVGLGLIGGSFAKAYADAGVKVYGADIDERSLAAAMAEGCVTGVLDETTVAACDSIIVALYPQDTIEWVARMAPHIAPDALVVDCLSLIHI